ncbi:C6 finger domain protein, putative [Metarhizium acridum CQMa 102]|uniref:C6 finger domain protein, putative n=1 Tax=Metarhizium acridum (strain CQMa 102) TaxID=655827 RepID=E9DSX8_METAQ|nr:C6 finger domain protein, putative [Metarhizium acridum CQMa 102]EFY93488.1 C6 finger domain protein, putative [Metarhizium acridum CQMa 102]
MADGGSMQPDSKQSQPSSALAPAQQQNSNTEDEAKGKKPAVKKRTKTGCLTCRKRRIKCDETKPRCKNCIKSKRPCEGYTQRVVFKDPANLGTTHGHFGPAIYPPGTRQQSASIGLHPHQANPQASLQPIAPRPATFNGSHRQPMSFAQAHSSHSSLPNYPPIPNPLLGPDTAHLTQNYYMGSSYGEVPPDALGQEQISREEQLGPSFEYDMPSNRGYGWPDRTQYGHGVIEDEVAMDDSDDESPDPQSLIVRDYRDVLKPYTRGGTEVRTFSAFAQNYALSEYMDYVHSSELRRHDMQTIFRHFVSVTGPTMSLYERDPTSLASGARFDGDATLDNNLWSHCKSPKYSGHSRVKALPYFSSSKCEELKRMRHFPSPLSAPPSIGPRRDPADLDYGLLSTITGHRVTAEDYGLQEGQLLDEECLWTTDKDIETYDMLRDLFWWYAKMDVYQSMLGGTKLFMEYEHWTQCPPRAPLSSINSIFGTYDHLILLLGRLASFTSKDLSRKRKAFRAKGGGSFRGGSSPSQFPGIVPTLGKFHAPIGFSAQSSYSDESDSPGDTATPESNELAEQEWESIRQAFETFENRLDARFKPLNSEYADHKDTPFGTALQYRTYSVAGIWMNYYMGLIHLYRSRPNMPPAAMQAAGMAAPSTAGYAIQIGRIAAGLTDNCSTKKDISTTLAAALIESSFCLFVAAVQLQDNNQRCWVIQRVFDITRLTGWQTARKIAIGCESAWIKVAQLGHGPEYKRPQHLEEVPTSVWMNPRKLDQRIQDLQNTTETRLVLHRSEQTNLALGLLGVETDLEVLDLREDR